MSNKPKNIVIHHTAVSRDVNPQQFAAVRKYHISKGWGDIGYHYFIESDGQVVPGRTEDTEGAHTKEQAMNCCSLGICLTGHFDTEDPTAQQLTALNQLVLQLREKYTISPEAVYGHRYFANYKSCPGVRFTDQMLEEIALGKCQTQFTPPEWAQPGIDWAIQNKVLTQVTGEPISDYRLAAILHNFWQALPKPENDKQAGV